MPRNASCRYFELNAVRAGMVAAPEDYQWSSFRAKSGITDPAWLDLDSAYLGLATTAKKRRKKYRNYILAAVPDGEIEQIRGAIQRGQLTGSDKFIEEIEAKGGKRIEFRGPGRPKKRIA